MSVLVSEASKVPPQKVYHFSFDKYLSLNTVFPPSCLLQGRCSRENCKYLHPPPHLKTQLEINGRNNLIQQKNMAMLAQQMQLANAMMPGTQLPPMVRGHTRMNTPQLLPTVRPYTCKKLTHMQFFHFLHGSCSLFAISPALFPLPKTLFFVVHISFMSLFCSLPAYVLSDTGPGHQRQRGSRSCSCSL